MTFDKWWETLSDAERKLLGENNAKFVWKTAHKYGYDRGFDIGYESGYASGNRAGYSEAETDIDENV